MSLQEKLNNALAKREEANLLRKLPITNTNLIDFASNDYLGLSRNPQVLAEVQQNYEQTNQWIGSGGSRLLAGNYPYYEELEHFLAEVHKCDYSIVGPNHKLNIELKKLEGRKIIYTNANMQHALDVLERIELSNFFDEIYDIKMANYIPKPEIAPYQQLIEQFTIEAESAAMFDDIAKNLVPAKKVGFTSVWIDAGYENFSDDIQASKEYLDHETTNITDFLENVNKGNI